MHFMINKKKQLSFESCFFYLFFYYLLYFSFNSKSYCWSIFCVRINKDSFCNLSNASSVIFYFYFTRSTWCNRLFWPIRNCTTTAWTCSWNNKRGFSCIFKFKNTYSVCSLFYCSVINFLGNKFDFSFVLCLCNKTKCYSK